MRDHGRPKLDQAKRLNDLERKNKRLRKAVSVLALDQLKEAIEGKYWASSAAAIVLSACSRTPVPFDAAPDPWIKKASASPIASLANGITKDNARRCRNEPWSNGHRGDRSSSPSNGRYTDAKTRLAPDSADRCSMSGTDFIKCESHPKLQADSGQSCEPFDA